LICIADLRVIDPSLGVIKSAEMPAIRNDYEQLFGRRTDALTNFLANGRTVLRHFQDRVVFLYREALVGDSLCQGINGLIQNALFIGRGAAAPGGRPRRITAGRANALALKEAYRSVLAREGDKVMRLPAIQAVCALLSQLRPKGMAPPSAPSSKRCKRSKGRTRHKLRPRNPDILETGRSRSDVQPVCGSTALQSNYPWWRILLRAALRAAAERPADPFVRAALRAAAERSDPVRREAARFA
jgi:hypothetical protein